MNKSSTVSFKAQVVLELLQETKTLAQRAAEHGDAVTVLREWKLAALKGLPDWCERRDSVTELKVVHERELAERYADWLLDYPMRWFVAAGCAQPKPRISMNTQT
jgi:hypothetical protein